MHKVEEIEQAIKEGRRAEQFSLDLDWITAGEKRRLYEIMYNHGPGNGKIMLLPIDQGLEHGPSDFFPNPPSVDFEFQLSLAKEGGYSGVVCHIGLAERHFKKYAGDVPLILKINGKTNIPSDEEAFSPLDADVEDAVRLGADAIGYTLYVGSPSQDRDFLQFMQVRQEARRFGMPVIMWAYPRGKFAELHGGRDCLAMVDYAARVANELGAHLVKLNLPKPPKGGEYDPKGPFKGYNQHKGLSAEEGLKMVVQSAGRTGVLVSGGSKISDEDLLNKAKLCLEAGVNGIIFGRNMWQRKYEDALRITKEIKEMMRRY
ncbi:MAG: fructose-bisphosphate aldolase [Candidatus Latescibacterota bacterium]|nr:MAG: fructose-bisphosphate aldolase [Candidatus Latescibacterota bacterium]